MKEREDRKIRLRSFTEETGWKVTDDFLGCWHAAVGRKKCGLTCRMTLSLPEYGLADHWHTDPIDHARRAQTPNGERVILCSPYVLDQRGAEALSQWCDEHGLTWSAVPAGWYWPGVALSVVIRNSDTEPYNWVPDPIRWERWKR